MRYIFVLDYTSQCRNALPGRRWILIIGKT